MHLTTILNGGIMSSLKNYCDENLGRIISYVWADLCMLQSTRFADLSVSYNKELTPLDAITLNYKDQLQIDICAKDRKVDPIEASIIYCMKRMNDFKSGNRSPSSDIDHIVSEDELIYSNDELICRVKRASENIDKMTAVTDITQIVSKIPKVAG